MVCVCVCVCVCLLLPGAQELTNSLQAEEDKANRLGKLKMKLENTIAETNDELEREKRLRGDVEKVRRKLEADIKVLSCYQRK